MPNLIVERGREKGQSFELAAGASLIVGRDPQSAQAVIADAAASRRHFQVAARNGKWFVADLGSKNSTYVNEVKIDKEVELAPGDQIQVGETVFTFIDDLKAEDKSAGLQGKEIGGYRILERIGRGGMGTVFKAKQVSLNRLVALKFLSPKLSKDPAFVNKFFAEARAAAQLNHPNVVQVFDVGTLGGVHFFSMEFMEGGCVQDLLTSREDSRLPWQEALHVIVEATRGLVFAEKRGIIHRDIKPDNLMLTSEQKVKIGDLGLATSAESTTEKGIFGTPHFIAPEQAQGKEVTHAADLYSLGATFYRVVCGRTPFSGSTVKDILRAQINDPHQPIPEIVPDFPPELAEIVDKLMAKRVEDRYQSATKLLEDLEAFQLAHQIELAGGVKSRKPFLVAVGVLVVALAGVGWWAMTRPEGETKFVTTTDPEAEARRKKAEQEAEEARKEQRRAAAEAAAEKAFLALELKDARLDDHVALDKKDAWLALSEEYDKFAADNPDATTSVAKATKRAADIRVRIEELVTLQNTVVKTAQEWWKKSQDEIKVLVGSGKWGDAIRRAQAEAAGPDCAKHKAHLTEDPVKWFGEIPNDCYKAATDENTTAYAEADRLLKSAKSLEAMRKVEAWEKRLREQGFEDPKMVPVGDKFLLLAEQAKTWREQKAGEVRAGLQSALDADKGLYIGAWRKVRTLAGADADGGPVYRYRFADAARSMRADAEGRIKSWIYLDRVEGAAARLDAAQAAWDAWTRLVTEKQLWAPHEEIKGLPGVAEGTKVTLDGDKPATGSEVYVVLSLSGGSTKRALQYDDYAPADIWRIFLAPHLDRVPPELCIELAKTFAILGEEIACASLYDRAKAPPEQAGWVLAELRAMQDYGRIAQLGPSQFAEQIKGIEVWRKAHYRADFFILVDGRPAEETPHVFSDEELNRYVEALGEKP